MNHIRIKINGIVVDRVSFEPKTLIHCKILNNQAIPPKVVLVIA
jgi:hypothetical protein